MKQPRGRFFKFVGPQVTIHELTGWVDGDYWVLKSAPREETHFYESICPEPCLPDILSAIEIDDLNGFYDLIRMVMVSASIGVALYLEGALSEEHFAQARELTVGDVDVVYLPEVVLGNHQFPLAIIPLSATDRDIIATIDADSRSTGEPDIYPVPSPYSRAKNSVPIPFYQAFQDLVASQPVGV